jgi:hypothetical protein
MDEHCRSSLAGTSMTSAQDLHFYSFLIHYVTSAQDLHIYSFLIHYVISDQEAISDKEANSVDPDQME